MTKLILNGWAEKRKINPAVLAFISLPVIFILYQGLGATFLIIYEKIFPGNHLAVMRFSQILSQFLFLLLPIYFFSRLHTTEVRHYVFLSNSNLGTGWILIPASVIVFQPIMQFLSGLERMIPWPEHFIEFRDQLEALLKTAVNADSIPELLIVVFMAALTPAICEEFYFRGYFLRNMSRKYTGKSAVIISGLIFGLFHFNPFQLSGLILMGIYFSFLTWHYKSLWASMIAHFANNSLVIVAYYISKEQLIEVNLDDPNLQIPMNMVLISVALFTVLFLFILNSKKTDPV